MTIEVGQRVGWAETYRTCGNVIAQRTEWGVVLNVFDHPGGRDGFPIQGTYVLVDQESIGRGRGAVLVSDLHTVCPV